MIKLIIFDSDNTLIDYSKMAAPCFQRAARKLDLRVPRLREINELWGRSLEYMVNEIWGRSHIGSFRKQFFLEMSKHKFKEINGAKKIVVILSKQFKLGVLSAKPRSLMVKNFNDSGFNTKVFRFMLSGDDSRYHKPDPRVFNEIIKSFRIRSQDIVYVGDALVDYFAAQKASVRFVAVLTGYYKKRDFINNGLEEDNILKSIKDFPRWLKRNE